MPIQFLNTSRESRSISGVDKCCLKFLIKCNIGKTFYIRELKFPETIDGTSIDSFTAILS